MTKIKLREWKPKKKIKRIVDVILGQVSKYKIPITVRQVHYILTKLPKEKHPNTKNGYKKVSRILTNMRYAGLLDWDKVVDETRDVYKTLSYKDIDEAEKQLLEKYRRDRWKNSPYYVEVWVEKRTLVRQFYEVTDEYDVYLASGGGFSSATYIKEAVYRLYPKFKEGKEIHILYFGDLDPSGDFMDEDIEKRFAEWDIPLKITRVCLNEEHLDKYDIPKKFDEKVKKDGKIYNKIQADPRARRMYKKFGEVFQVEIEALDPNVLSQILEDELLKFVDLDQQEKIKKVEKREVKKVKKKLGYTGKNKSGNKNGS